MRHTRLPMREAMQLFDLANEADGLAKSTLANQRSHARKLEKALSEWEVKRKRPGKPMWADEADAVLVSLYLSRCNGGEGSRANMTAYLRRLLQYCERNDWLVAGTTAKIMHGRRGKSFQRKPKTYIPAADFPKLLECQTRHPADRATMALLLWTLCRKSELYGLRWAHVDLENRRIMKVYRVKTKRWTPVTICPELWQELHDYKKWYTEEMGGVLDLDWHVLPELIPVRGKGPDGKYDGSCTSFNINPERHPFHMEKIVKLALDHIGVTDTEQGKTVNHVGEGAHTIRRSGARAMLKHLSANVGFGDALDTVRAMLDHKDVKMTLLYIGMERTQDELNDWLLTNNPYGSAH